MKKTISILVIALLAACGESDTATSTDSIKSVKMVDTIGRGNLTDTADIKMKKMLDSADKDVKIMIDSSKKQ